MIKLIKDMIENGDVTTGDVIQINQTSELTVSKQFSLYTGVLNVHIGFNILTTESDDDLTESITVQFEKALDHNLKYFPHNL